MPNRKYIMKQNRLITNKILSSECKYIYINDVVIYITIK